MRGYTPLPCIQLYILRNEYLKYIGKVVNGVEGLILAGALRFPENKAITELEDAAKAMATQHDALDPLTFGRCTN